MPTASVQSTPGARVVSVLDLGRASYAAGLEAQRKAAEEVLASRDAAHPHVGTILLLEHDPPVITLTRRAAPNLVAGPELLARLGVELAETDRGGDITYHGPGQLVVYPILDLQRLGWNLHHYMRTLEQAVIDACAGFGLATSREPGATGVWTIPADGRPGAKVCAMGVRVRRWITTHGLALNVSTDLDHFSLIVPCGLAGRPVTSLERELGSAAPTMPQVKDSLAAALVGACGASRA